MENIASGSTGPIERYPDIQNAMRRIISDKSYQLKVLTYVAWKLTKKPIQSIKDWWLTTEINSAPGFHDLILKYKDDTANGQTLYHLVQIKHSSPNKIKLNQLSERNVNDEDHQYSLTYLFKCYLNTQKKLQNNRDIATSDQIKYLTVFTDQDFATTIDFLSPVSVWEEDIFLGKGKRYSIDINKLQTNPDIMANLRKVVKTKNNTKDQIIFDFLRKLTYAVDQPSGFELDEAIINDIMTVHSSRMYNHLYENIIEWFLIYKNGNENYLTKINIENYINKNEEEIQLLIYKLMFLIIQNELLLY